MLCMLTLKFTMHNIVYVLYFCWLPQCAYDMIHGHDSFFILGLIKIDVFAEYCYGAAPTMPSSGTQRNISYEDDSSNCQHSKVTWLSFIRF